MKNIINYYYNLLPENVFQNDKEYYFFINSIRYSLIEYKGEEKDIYETYNKHLDILKKIYVHPIILNKKGYPYTKIDKKNYILMQTIYYGNKVNIDNIIPFTKIIATENDNTWNELWSQKNDYLEYQTKLIETKYPLLKKSFGYFIGLAETAISIVNITEKQPSPNVYAHKRINKKSTTFDLYNPLNITEDLRVRDPAEYFKQNFFKGENIEPELNKYFKNEKLNKYEYLMFLARMLYPTYYFDMYEDIITGKIEEKNLNQIIEKVEDYEQILKKIYNYYKSFMNIFQIEWLEY